MKNANWLGIISNIGVLIGIVFLAIEINQNSDLARAQIHQSRTDALTSDRFDLGDSEFIAPAIVKMGGMSNVSGLDSLDPLEFERIRNAQSAIFTNYDNLFYQYQKGYLDEEYYEFFVAANIKRFSPVWERLGFLDRIRPSFKVEIQRISGVE